MSLKKCETGAIPGCGPQMNQTGTRKTGSYDSLHPHLSMSPCISLLPLWDMSREEAASEARPVFRAYR